MPPFVKKWWDSFWMFLKPLVIIKKLCILLRYMDKTPLNSKGLFGYKGRFQRLAKKMVKGGCRLDFSLDDKRDPAPRETFG